MTTPRPRRRRITATVKPRQAPSGPELIAAIWHPCQPTEADLVDAGLYAGRGVPW